MSELIDKLRPEFQDKEYRDAYAEECLNTMIATQIKVLREQRKMTQGQVAEATGMKQPRVAVLEDASYENWSVNTLKRFARAFDVALSVKFETFSKLIEDFENISRESLQRPTFADDARFQHRTTRRSRFRRSDRRSRFSSRRRSRNWIVASPSILAPVQVMEVTRKPPRSAEAAEGGQQNQDAGTRVAAAGANRS
ncbi:MAG: helix-turn-helix transcriptional regulator [Candidatus Sulfotelmatobacter sp.]